MLSMQITEKPNGNNSGLRMVDMEGIRSDIKALSSSNNLLEFDTLRITAEKEIPNPDPTVKIGDASIACPGNITAISAAAKAGKTALINVLAAGAISKTGNIDGFDHLSVIPNTNSRAVIIIDTEQSSSDQQYNVNTIIKRARFDTTPDHLQAYNIRQVKFVEYKGITESICNACASEFGGIHMIIIDGGADYIPSVNDESAASEIIQYFTHLSIRYECPVIVVIHQNPGSDKERGHLGSEIQRKCYGLLTISKQDDISTVSPKIMRKAGNSDVPEINFRFCKEKGYHIQVDPIESDSIKAQKSSAKLREIADRTFAPLSAIKYKDAVAIIMENEGKGERTAKSLISKLISFGLIKKHDDGSYRLVQ